MTERSIEILALWKCRSSKSIVQTCLHFRNYNIHYLGCSELSLWKQNWSNLRPDKQSSSCPPGHNPDPDRWPPDVHQFSTLPHGGWPTCKKHGRVHTSKRKDKVEERIGVCDWLGPLLFFLLINLVQRQQRLPCTFNRKTSSLGNDPHIRRSYSAHIYGNTNCFYQRNLVVQVCSKYECTANMQKVIEIHQQLESEYKTAPPNQVQCTIDLRRDSTCKLHLSGQLTTKLAE